MKSSPHEIDLNVIADGSRAAMAAWPDEPAGPPTPPRGAHEVLWVDDWRGADLAREAATATPSRGRPSTAAVSGRQDAHAPRGAVRAGRPLRGPGPGA